MSGSLDKCLAFTICFDALMGLLGHTTFYPPVKWNTNMEIPAMNITALILRNVRHVVSSN